MADLKTTIHKMLKTPILASLATVTTDGKPWVRYVMVQADENLSLHFSTFRGSRKAAQIRKNAEVHIVCGVASLASAKQYLQIQGKARLHTDAKTKQAYWNDGLKAYFTGPADPNYVVVAVAPYQIEYQTMKDRNPMIWKPEAKKAKPAKKSKKR
jgi:general stress protein 26